MDQRKTAASGGTTSCRELFIAAKTEAPLIRGLLSSGNVNHLHVEQLQYVRLNSSAPLI